MGCMAESRTVVICVRSRVVRMGDDVGKLGGRVSFFHVGYPPSDVLDVFVDGLHLVAESSEHVHDIELVGLGWLRASCVFGGGGRLWVACSWYPIGTVDRGGVD